MSGTVSLRLRRLEERIGNGTGAETLAELVAWSSRDWLVIPAAAEESQRIDQLQALAAQPAAIPFGRAGWLIQLILRSSCRSRECMT